LAAHARRSVMGLSGMFLTLGAVRLLPLSEATVLGFTAPIFATVLALVVLRERVGAYRATAVALGFAGILVIAGPDRAAMPPFGFLVGIGGAFMVALISIQLRDLGRTEEALSVVFYFSGFSALVLALALPWTAQAHDLAGWAILGGIGLTGLFGQIALTAALRYGSVASVIVMDYSSFVWATLWGWLVFTQLPPTSTWSGAPLVIGAGLIIVYREHQLSLQRPVESVS
jgi:drug/metabolite transporter (DMT)-like permease